MTARKILILTAILAIPLVIGAAIFGWSANAVLAQGPWQGGNFANMHNNQALFELLKTDRATLLQKRQAGSSLLDIAAANGVSEQVLLDALAQPIGEMHAWMQQQYPQSDTTTMTEAMRGQFAQDIRVAQYGTMTDMHIFGMNGAQGMMGWMMNGNGNGYGGMMNGKGYGGMMGGMMNGNRSGYGGMMNGNGYGGMMGGMMNGYNNAPAVNATPVPSTQQVDREVKINAGNFKFDPSAVTVKQGETVKFSFANQDNFAHNVISQDGKLAYTLLPANQTTTILWSAPKQAGSYEFICTFHPNMQFTVTVE